MKKKLFSLALLLLIFLSFTPLALAQDKIFTAEELSQFDGKEGRKAYYAFEGKVYDVTSSPYFKLGEHFGHYAGEDLTGALEEAPHGMEVFVPFKIVGSFESLDSTWDTQAVVGQDKWYEGRIKIFGFSILGWTGILMGIFFVLTFATCFAMPWCKVPLPWLGSRIGPDPLDASGKRMTFSSIHKHFVWWAVILGIIHGVLGFLQMIGIYL
ncbi:MAG: cytochrome b5 domain-containing protein [Patescibacteria group bacterium]